MTRKPPHEHLTVADVENLFSEPTEDVRKKIACKVASQFSNVVLTPRERELAQEILGYLVLDLSAQVRVALSVALCDMPNVPHAIVLQLAQDIDDVAQPILENSKVLTDADLAELALSGSARKQAMIAGRVGLGIKASSAIASGADRTAVLRLITNDGVVLQPEVLDTILQRYNEDEEILDPMARRKDLPLRIVERIVTFVSKGLRDHLVQKYRIDPKSAAVLEDQARERTLIAMMDQEPSENLDGLLAQLVETGKLTSSLLLRAVCAGEIDFVIKGLAIMTSIQTERAARLINDVGPLGFRALHARAGMPELYYPAFRGALDVLREIGQKESKPSKAELAQMVMTRVAPLYRDVRANDLGLLVDRLTRAANSAPWVVKAA